MDDENYKPAGEPRRIGNELDSLRRGFFMIATSNRPHHLSTHHKRLPQSPAGVGESGLRPVRLVPAGRSFGGRASAGGPAAFVSAGRLFCGAGPLPSLVLCGLLRSPPGPLRLGRPVASPRSSGLRVRPSRRPFCASCGGVWRGSAASAHKVPPPPRD